MKKLSKWLFRYLE